MNTVDEARVRGILKMLIVQARESEAWEDAKFLTWALNDYDGVEQTDPELRMMRAELRETVISRAIERTLDNISQAVFVGLIVRKGQHHAG